MTLEGSNPPWTPTIPPTRRARTRSARDKSLGPRKKPPSPLPPADCTCGSAWMATAAEMMAALADRPLPTPLVSALVSADAAHSVSDVRPFHLPHIFNPPPGHACNTSTHCAINLTTLTEPVYDSRDALDTGLYPIAATELRAKMKSRQAVWQAAGVSAADFQTLDRDNTSICRVDQRGELRRRARRRVAARARTLRPRRPAARLWRRRVGGDRDHRTQVDPHRAQDDAVGRRPQRLRRRANVCDREQGPRRRRTPTRWDTTTASSSRRRGRSSGCTLTG